MSSGTEGVGHIRRRTFLDWLFGAGLAILAGTVPRGTGHHRVPAGHQRGQNAPHPGAGRHPHIQRGTAPVTHVPVVETTTAGAHLRALRERSSTMRVVWVMVTLLAAAAAGMWVSAPTAGHARGPGMSRMPRRAGPGTFAGCHRPENQEPPDHGGQDRGPVCVLPHHGTPAQALPDRGAPHSPPQRQIRLLQGDVHLVPQGGLGDGNRDRLRAGTVAVRICPPS